MIAGSRALIPLQRRASRALRNLHDRLILRHRITVSTWWRVGRHHAAPISPLRALDVDPSSINRWLDMEIADYRRIRYRFDVRDGSWDLTTASLDQHFVYTSLEARFRRGVPWSETAIFHVAMEGIVDGSVRYHGCRTLVDLERRLDRLDALYARIDRDGYRSQSELRQSASSRLTLTRRTARPALLDEVVVHVDRNGGFILVDGVHRFSIARLLDIEHIPAIVLWRHAEWQARRDALARSGGTSEDAARHHPDLVGLTH